MLNIDSFSLGELQTNCYILSDSDSNEALVIDPADEGEFIANEVVNRGLTITGIVLTHGHFDHVLGLLALASNFQVPTYLHFDDLFLIKQAQSSALHWLKHPVDPVPPPTHDLSEKTPLKIGKTKLSVLHTPGHTPGSICLYAVTENILICGDTVFKDGVGRTDFRYSDKNDLRKSLQQIFDLPLKTLVFPGHGESTTVAEIRSNLLD